MAGRQTIRGSEQRLSKMLVINFTSTIQTRYIEYDMLYVIYYSTCNPEPQIYEVQDLMQVGHISVGRPHCGASHSLCGPDALLCWGDSARHNQGGVSRASTGVD